MNEEIRNQKVIDYLYDFCLSAENLDESPQLIDYGGNHNLLELKRTEGYTHYTASPNGERLLTFQLITEMFAWLEKETPHDLISRGQILKEVFREKLWDNENQWVRSLDAEGNPQNAYSIQVFDVLRSGILSKKEEQAVLSHLKEGEFLSEWGVHSLAVSDPGYDPKDVDWGGPGVFAGDAPELIIDLLDAGYIDQGIDLLNRILWWGELPYYPQAIRANIKGYRENGRPNVIAGLTASQSIITGLFGIHIQLDQIRIKPIDHPIMKGMALRNIKLRNKEFEIIISNEKSEFEVITNNISIRKSIGEEIIFDL